MSAKQDVVFFCWRCGQKLAVPDSMQGKTLPCPKCQRRLTVPTDEYGVDKREVPSPPSADDLVVKENDMTFNCQYCDWCIIIDKRGAGLTVKCPGCGKLITAPQSPEAPLPAEAAPAAKDPVPSE